MNEWDRFMTEYDKLMTEWDKLMETLHLPEHKFTVKEVEEIIKDYDFVPVVRCKDCKWHEDKEPGMVWCSHIVGSWIGEEDYCSMGERREDAEKTD
jgi:hypothetical protein